MEKKTEKKFVLGLYVVENLNLSIQCPVQVGRAGLNISQLSQGKTHGTGIVYHGQVTLSS